MKRFEKYIEYIGTKIGQWQILDLVTGEQEKNGVRPTSFKCKCECGLEDIISACRLIANRGKICKICLKDRRRIKAIYGILNKSRHATKKRKLEFSIELQYMIDLLEKQDYKCAISGLAITPGVNRSNSELSRITASIDRIDSSKGYIVGNVQWVHKYINIMKWNIGEDEFVGYCHTISEYQKNKNKPDAESLEKYFRGNNNLRKGIE